MNQPDIRSRTFLVTGTTSGIGRAVAEALATRGANVVLAARSEERMRPVLDGIRAARPLGSIHFLPLDLADLSSVRRAADQFISGGQSLDVLINNAGVAGVRSLSADGFDITYATNHIGPFLFTTLLLPVLRRSPQARVVNVSSVAHLQVKSIDWTVLERRTAPGPNGFADYAVTKLMNVLHAKELGRRSTGTSITTYSLHPGGVASNIWRALPRPAQWILKLFLISNEEGAKTPLYCATDPALATVTGRYYEKSREASCNPLADDEPLAKELWDRTEIAIARSA